MGCSGRQGSPLSGPAVTRVVEREACHGGGASLGLHFLWSPFVISAMTKTHISKVVNSCYSICQVASSPARGARCCPTAGFSIHFIATRLLQLTVVSSTRVNYSASAACDECSRYSDLRHSRSLLRLAEDILRLASRLAAAYGWNRLTTDYRRSRSKLFVGDLRHFCLTVKLLMLLIWAHLLGSGV